VSGSAVTAIPVQPGTESRGGIVSWGRPPADLHWWAGALLSVGCTVAVCLALGRDSLALAARSAPVDPAFWLAFVACYLISPICEFTIFRRLWKLPPIGLAALVRKQVTNELVFGYSGEAQFYLWARRHAKLSTSPFGAVKDVAMLSAIAGNLATLVLMAVNWPIVAPFVVGPLGRTFAISAGLIASASMTMFLLRRRLFSLPAKDLWTITAVHAARIAGSLLLLGMLWHLLLPELRLDGLLVLATLRLMLSRLPFLPAKEVVFAGLVAALLGRGAAVVPAIALIGSLVIATHVVVAICSAAAALAKKVAEA
jgi:hypothetical protein